MQAVVQFTEIKKSFFRGGFCRSSSKFICCNKKSNELIAHTYSELFKIPSTGLRFLQSMDLGAGLIWQ